MGRLPSVNWLRQFHLKIRQIKEQGWWNTSLADRKLRNVEPFPKEQIQSSQLEVNWLTELLISIFSRGTLCLILKLKKIESSKMA